MLLQRWGSNAPKKTATKHKAGQRPRPEPRTTISVQMPYELDLQLEDRALALAIPKRKIIEKGCRLALNLADEALLVQKSGQ